MKVTTYVFVLLLLKNLFFTFQSHATINNSGQQTAIVRIDKGQRMQWWREARFGMFIHWGVYAVYGNVYHGQDITGETVSYEMPNSGYPSEWIMSFAKIPREEYKKAADWFDAKDYNPKEWVDMAKNAGMKYIVITTKHHDGFCLFETKVTDWNSTDASAAKKDLIKELVAEAKKAGLKVGFYYSQNRDWMQEGGMGPVPELNNELYPIDQVKRYVNSIVIPHIQELTAKYDFDIFWFDSHYVSNTNMSISQDIFQALLSSKVGDKIIINDRLVLNFPESDFITPETDTPNIPYNGYSDGTDWEACASLSTSWGYEYPTAWRTSLYTVGRLLEIASKGGNFLLNVGPDKHGVIPEPAVNVLKEVGEWMAKYKETIYGTVKNDLLNPFEYGYVTQKNNLDGKFHWYLHISQKYWDDGVVYLDGVTELPQSCVLFDNKEEIIVKKTASGLALYLPENISPDPYYTTIDLSFAKQPEQERVSALREGAVHLTPFQAKTTSMLKKDEIPYAIIGWTREDCKVDFQVYLTPGVYSIQTEYSAYDDGEIYFKINNKVYTGSYLKTARNMKTYIMQDYPDIQIHITKEGVYNLNITRKVVSGFYNIINLRNVILKLISTIGTNSIQNFPFVIYPNPVVDGWFRIDSEEKTIEIYDLYGRLRHSFEGGIQKMVDVSFLCPGVYVIKSGKHVQQIIVR